MRAFSPSVHARPARRAAAVWLALFLAASAGFAAPAAPRGPLTAILGAMPVEVRLLQAQLQGKETTVLLGQEFHTGTLAGRRAVVTCSGVGKVNAAVSAALLLDHFHPDEVIFTGVAGAIGPELGPGDIVLGEKTTQHDYGFQDGKGFECRPTANPTTGRKNPTLFPSSPLLMRLAEQAAQKTAWQKPPGAPEGWRPRIARGVIATGDVFVASPEKKTDLRERLRAEAVEMEGAAVAQVCWQQGVECLVIRAISDKADGTAWGDFEQFAAVAAANSARLTEALLGLLVRVPAGQRGSH